ncbi:uncharacterized protein F5147DRAFT_648317 [Suillus discolor]|uniref:Uncharacterized protein n=1 Tax=Suillus discolor TaxID=1912936 RepID=A0A9P7JZB3_9AGAM|nr:uncharacterized protein F5147DRAFT_648317 [Suillus discolor]KAG2117873.1 hypothetical protein F5147DRAFT_648317 [Suillus discolor]
MDPASESNKGIFCRDVKADSQPCDCEEFFANSQDKGHCVECGHGHSKHPHNVSGYKVENIQDEPHPSSSAAIKEIFDRVAGGRSANEKSSTTKIAKRPTHTQKVKGMVSSEKPSRGGQNEIQAMRNCRCYLDQQFRVNSGWSYAKITNNLCTWFPKVFRYLDMQVEKRTLQPWPGQEEKSVWCLLNKSGLVLTVVDVAFPTGSDLAKHKGREKASPSECHLWFVMRNQIPDDIYKSWNTQPVIVGSDSEHDGSDQLLSDTDSSAVDKSDNELDSDPKVKRVLSPDKSPSDSKQGAQKKVKKETVSFHSRVHADAAAGLRLKNELSSPPEFMSYSSSWQPQPNLSGSFRGPSPGNVRREFATILVGDGATTVTAESTSSPAVTNEPRSMPDSLKPEDQNVESNIEGPVYFPSFVDLHQLSISRIWNGGDGPKLEVFLNVSEEDYTYILDVIRSDCRVVHKLSYIPHLQKLIATLPSPIHEVILVPLHTAMGIIVDSLTIPDDFNVSLPIHMAHMLEAPTTSDLPPNESYQLGIPDLVLMLQTCDTDILPLWPFEVSVSETSESAIGRLQTYGDWNKNILAGTHISIVEAQTHVPPTYEWGIKKELDQRGVQIKDLACLEDGGVVSLSHTWYHPTTVTITTWIHPPNKPLNLNSHQCGYYATALLYPNQDNKGLEKVKCHIYDTP